MVVAQVHAVEFGAEHDLEDLPVVLAACDIFVRPSLIEGMGSAFVEAFAAGLPIIATPVGGIPDLVKDGVNGFLFKVGNIEQLAEKLRTLLSNKEMAVEMGRKGKELIQSQFSNEKYIQNYLQMINQ